ncbi:flagellar basal body-associated protein FliL [Fictibacillus sp. Mic-4]|uniref:flagellar basal body-associated protein FliL n=1 Tax=Fictibacillus TaxID=1329200 RepID=UPI0004074250|nr:flagellar basal body-associated protein FliL [Fictibacillus gelatini]
MEKSKKTVVIGTVISSVIIAGLLGFYLFHQFSPKSKEENSPAADELEKLTVETEEITTNLADDSYIKVKFKLLAGSKKAKQEIEQRLFQINNIIIYELSDKKANDLKGQKGITGLEDVLKQKINRLMQEGKVVRVYTTEKIVQ